MCVFQNNQTLSLNFWDCVGNVMISKELGVKSKDTSTLTKYVLTRNFDLSKWRNVHEKTTTTNFLQICMEVWLLHCRWYSSFCGSCSSGKLELYVWVKSPRPLAKHLKLVRGQPEMRLCRLSVFLPGFLHLGSDVYFGMGFTLDMETSRFSYILSHLTPNYCLRASCRAFTPFAFH